MNATNSVSDGEYPTAKEYMFPWTLGCATPMRKDVPETSIVNILARIVDRTIEDDENFDKSRGVMMWMHKNH